MFALSDTSQAVDHAGEREEAIADRREAAIDKALLEIKRDPNVREELWQSLLDSGNGPATNAAHGNLIESLAALDADLIVATDAESVRRRMLLLDAIVCTAFDDVLIARAEKAVRS